MTPSKFALLRVAKQQLGMDEESYRAVLQRCGHVTSAKDLTDQGFDAVMEEFERLGFQSTKRQKAFGKQRFNMASPSQLSKIQQLWAIVTDDAGTPEGLDKWLSNRFQISALRFVTPAIAKKSIGALRNWCRKRGIDIPAS